MIEQYPVTPPPELVAQIRSDALRKSSDVLDYELRMIHAAYRAGADQELEACCEWLQDPDLNVDTYKLRAARRPKPPSRPWMRRGISRRALAVLDEVSSRLDAAHEDILRRALEQLDD